MSKLLKKYRTYFDKNNTIVRNSLVNTANNPVSQLMFGEASSRFLFFTEFAELQGKIDADELDLNKTTHKLFIKNTSNFDVSQIMTQNSVTYDGMNRAYSVDIELHAIPEYWDAGVGLDFVDSIYNNPDERVFVNGASNWTDRTNTNEWAYPGAISSGSTAIATVHLDNGGEDVVMDVTEAVNAILSGTSVNYGFLLKFSNNIEISDNPTSYIGLFTKHTQTYFEPYIETTQNISIYDDRRNFYANHENSLYLYAVIGGQLRDLDELPVFSVENTNLTGIIAERIAKGIYLVQLTAEQCNLNAYVQYYDIWSNIIYNGVTLANIELDFVVMPYGGYYKIGTLNTETELYGISLSGIKVDERIVNGEVKTARVNIRKPNTPHFVNEPFELYYTLYVKQGPNRVTVIDWEKLDFLFSGFEFSLDTSWLIPQQYFIDIKVITNDEVRIFNEEVKFNIINDFTNKTKH